MQNNTTSAIRAALMPTVMLLLVLFVGSCDRAVQQDYDSISAATLSVLKFENNDVPCVNMTSSDGTVSSATGQRSTYPQSLAEINSSTASLILNKLEANLGFKLSRDGQLPKHIVLYTVGALHDITLASLKAVSLFTPTADGRLHHQLIKLNGSASQEDARFTLNTDYFEVSELHLLTSTF